MSKDTNLKILHIADLYFKLPEDFDGDENDAMELFYQYFKENHKNAIVDEHKDSSDNWDVFVNLWPFDERKVSCSIGIQILQDDNTWRTTR